MASVLPCISLSPHASRDCNSPDSNDASARQPLALLPREWGLLHLD